MVAVRSIRAGQRAERRRRPGLWMSLVVCAVVTACTGAVATAAPSASSTNTAAVQPITLDVMSFNLAACAYTESGPPQQKCDGDQGRSKHLDDIVNQTSTAGDGTVSYDFVATQEADLLTDRSPRTSGLLFQGARQGDGERPCLKASRDLRPAGKPFNAPKTNGMCINFGNPANTSDDPATLVKLMYDATRWAIDTTPYYQFIGQDKYRRAAGIAHFTHKATDETDNRGVYILDTHWPTNGAGNREVTMQMIDAYKKANQTIVKNDDPIIFMGDFNHEFITYRGNAVSNVEDFSPANPGFFHNANAEQLTGGRDKTFHNFTYEFTEPIGVKPQPDINPRMIDFIFYTSPLVLRQAEILHSPAQINFDTAHGLASDHFPVTASFLLP